MRLSRCIWSGSNQQNISNIFCPDLIRLLKFISRKTNKFILSLTHRKIESKFWNYWHFYEIKFLKLLTFLQYLQTLLPRVLETVRDVSQKRHSSGFFIHWNYSNLSHIRWQLLIYPPSGLIGSIFYLLSSNIVCTLMSICTV